MIGAGAIGLEFSLRYERLGSEVTLLTRGAILAEFPAQFGERLDLIYGQEGVRVLTQRSATRIMRDNSGGFVIETDGADSIAPILVEKILLAVGRRPALDQLGLEAAGVELNAKGRLEIDDDMRVKGFSHLFAAGDVAGLRMVVHHAHIEAGIAAENACSDGRRSGPSAPTSKSSFPIRNLLLQDVLRPRPRIKVPADQRFGREPRHRQAPPGRR